MQVFPILVIGIVGFIIGGIINLLADDLPQYRRPQLPHYPDGTPRPISAYLGTLAFLTNQRQSPQNDSIKLSWRYPLTEIATACMFMLTLYRIQIINTETVTVNATQAVFWLFYVGVFILIFVTDIEHHLILFSVIIPASIIALLDAILTPSSLPANVWQASHDPMLSDALIGAAVGFGIFFLFYLGGFFYLKITNLRRSEPIDDIAFGYGDVMLITLCGLILGWRPLIFTIFITVFAGAFGAILFLIVQRLRGDNWDIEAAIPYGPYILIGAYTMLVFSDWVRDGLLTLAYG